MIDQVEKSHEGVQFQEHELPIDISYLKLADWLVDRKRVSNDWRKRVATIQARVSRELQTLPKNVNTWFFSLTPENTSYLETCRVRDLLASANPESRTLFGGLSGAAGTWDALVRAYEKDFIYLGEASQILIQYTNYEIPFWKKQLSKLQQQLLDLDRRETDLKRNASLSAQKYNQACQELGIQGHNIKRELDSLVHELPAIFQQMVEEICSDRVGTAVDYYESFVEFARCDGTHVERMPLLPKITELRNNPPADAVVVTGRPEVLDEHSLHAIPLDLDAGDVASTSPSINWDFGAIDPEDQKNATEVPQISWDVDLSSLELPAEEPSEAGNEGGIETAADINWEIEMSPGEETNSGNAVEINWDVNVEDSAEEVGGGGNDVRQSLTGEFRVLHPLANTEHRNLLLDELYELQAFIQQRIMEMERQEFSAVQSQLLASAPPIVQQHGVDSLKNLDSALGNILDLFNKRKTRDLLLILTSPKFVERLATHLEQRKGQEKKLLDSLEEVRSRRQELRSSLNATWPKMDGALKRTRDVKELVEKTLSKQYQGRPVNIIGEINVALA